MVTSNLGELIYTLPASTKKQVRELERCPFKLCKQKCSNLFNQT